MPSSRDVLLDARDGGLLAFLEEPRGFFAAQIDERAQAVIANRRQMRCRSRSHAAGDRPAIDDDHLLPDAGEFVGDRQPGDAGSDDDGIAALLSREFRRVRIDLDLHPERSGLFTTRVHTKGPRPQPINSKPSR